LSTRPVAPDITRLFLLAAAVLLFLSFGYTEMAGSDMWWHIAAGRELAQTRTLWMVDDWSFTAAGQPWLNHEWLADVIYYGWVSTWGVESLVYWKWLVVVSTYAILLFVLTRETGSALAALICSAIAIAIAAPFLDVRPHLYTLLNFSLLLYLLLGRRAATWLLALVFLIWVNLHGGFFFGLMALGILLFPWRNPGPGNIRAALLVGLICLLACVLNPSGIKTFLYPLTYAFDTSSPFRQLGEWLSPFKRGGIISPLFFTFMWAPLIAGAYLLAPVRRAAAVPWEGLALTALTLAMALTSRRFIPLFGISLAVMMAPLMALCLRKLRVEKYALALAVLAFIYASLRMLPYPLNRFPAFHYLTAEYSYPVDMLDFIEVNGISGNVYALYNWGGYIHWRTDGALKVFIDGRADTIYDADTYNAYVSVLGSRQGWLAQIEDSAADYVLWPHRRGDGQRKLQELVETGRWRPLYRDSVAWLLARTTAELPDRPGDSPSGPWRDMGIAQKRARAGDTDGAIALAQRAREVMPWHKGACNLLTSSYRRLGRESEAEELLYQCRSYFPSALLR
jgi:hypothetical protein